MRYLRPAVLASTVSFALPAWAADLTLQPVPPPSASPWYIEGSVGALWRMDASRSITISNTIISGPGTNTTSYDPGPAFNVGIGYRLPEGFRVEAEFGFAHYTINSVSPVSTNGAFPQLNGTRMTLQSGGNHDEYAGTASAFYDLPIGGRFVPYLGAGFGVFGNTTSPASFTGPNGTFRQSDAHSTLAGVLAEAGVSIAVDPRWAVVPAYRFEHLFTASGAVPNNASIFKLGMRYAF